MTNVPPVPAPRDKGESLALGSLLRNLESQPCVVRSDLDAVADFFDALFEVFGRVRREVCIDRAVVELSNNAGYPVGHITFDAEADLYRFIPHKDED